MASSRLREGDAPGAAWRSRPATLAPLIAFALVVLAAAPADTPTADNLFDQSVVNDIRLTMKPGDWDTLRATCLEDT